MYIWIQIDRYTDRDRCIDRQIHICIDTSIYLFIYLDIYLYRYIYIYTYVYNQRLHQSESVQLTHCLVDGIDAERVMRKGYLGDVEGSRTNTYMYIYVYMNTCIRIYRYINIDR